jgi:hypothetical protein
LTSENPTDLEELPPSPEVSLLLYEREIQFLVPLCFNFVAESHPFLSRYNKCGVKVAGRCPIVVRTVSGKINLEITAPLVRMASLNRLMFSCEGLVFEYVFQEVGRHYASDDL